MIEILTQTMHNKLRQGYLKTWVFATSNSIKKLGEPLLSRFRVMCLNEYEFSQFYEIALRCYAVSDKSIIMTNMTYVQRYTKW